MILKTTHFYDEDDGKESLIVELGDTKLSFYDGEHEDNCLSRNFSDCWNISDIVQYANQLGLEGKKIEFISESNLD